MDDEGSEDEIFDGSVDFCIAETQYDAARDKTSYGGKECVVLCILSFGHIAPICLAL